MEYPEEFQREVNLEYYRAGIQSTREVGFIALKTLITLNSGAFVVLLTFIGNTAAQSQFVVPLDHLKFSMYCFLGGLAAVFLSIVQTYVSSRSASPYVEEDNRPEWRLALLSVILPALSFLAFVGGVISVVWGVELA
jgi:hypothetical protein